MQAIINVIREIFFKEIIGNINLYTIISFLFKFVVVFIVLYYIYLIVRLIILDIRNIDYTIKKKFAYVLVESGDGSEIRYDLEQVNSIGRSLTNDIVLDSNLVSKSHANILESNGIYYIVDKDSSNGTLLNGVKIDGNIELLDNDIIEMGEYKLYFKEEIKSINPEEGEQND